MITKISKNSRAETNKKIKNKCAFCGRVLGHNEGQKGTANEGICYSCRCV